LIEHLASALWALLTAYLLLVIAFGKANLDVYILIAFVAPSSAAIGSKEVSLIVAGLAPALWAVHTDGLQIAMIDAKGAGPVSLNFSLPLMNRSSAYGRTH